MSKCFCFAIVVWPKCGECGANAFELRDEFYGCGNSRYSILFLCVRQMEIE